MIVDFFIKILYKKKNKKYQRVLPFGEYFVDRWTKSRFLNFGKNSSIYDSSYVFGEVIVGEDCWIGPFTILDGSGGVLKIGDGCHISAGAQIYTHDTLEKVISDQSVAKSPTTIGNHCYIGPNVIIAKGVTIGDFAVIGANSFVNKDIPENKRAYGSPARIVE